VLCGKKNNVRSVKKHLQPFWRTLIFSIDVFSTKTRNHIFIILYPYYVPTGRWQGFIWNGKKFFWVIKIGGRSNIQNFFGSLWTTSAYFAVKKTETFTVKKPEFLNFSSFSGFYKSKILHQLLSLCQRISPNTIKSVQVLSFDKVKAQVLDLL